MWSNYKGAPAGNLVGEGVKYMGGVYVVGPAQGGAKIHFEFAEKVFGARERGEGRHLCWRGG